MRTSEWLALDHLVDAKDTLVALNIFTADTLNSLIITLMKFIVFHQKETRIVGQNRYKMHQGQIVQNDLLKGTLPAIRAKNEQDTIISRPLVPTWLDQDWR